MNREVCPPSIHFSTAAVFFDLLSVPLLPELLSLIEEQELVSMVPVALLSVEPHHVCLDCCASPEARRACLMPEPTTAATRAAGV